MFVLHFENSLGPLIFFSAMEAAHPHHQSPVFDPGVDARMRPSLGSMHCLE
jgi:hypothetical protein